VAHPTISTLQTTDDVLKENTVPLMPDGMVELLRKDADKSFDL
jgi:hypothetical protein